MAMFEIDDSDDVELLRCKTDSETLVKGARLNRLTAEDCEAARPSVPSSKSKIWVWVGSAIVTIGTTVIAAYITGFLGLT